MSEKKTGVLITGGTGFIGSALCRYFLTLGHEIWVLSRNPTQPGLIKDSHIHYVQSLNDIPKESSIDCVINLAGASLFDKRWSRAYQKIIVDSRLNTTRQLIDWMSGRASRPSVFISGSAVGYYGDGENSELSEESNSGSDFGAQLCVDWEKEALKAQDLGVRTCLIRTGIVVGKNGGALQPLLPIFKLGLGSPMGPGSQFWPWIHLDDHIAAINHLITNEQLTGAFNLTAPTPATNKVFTRALANSLNKPFFLPPTPGFVLKLMLGGSADLLIDSQRVLPSKLMTSGFKFQYTEIDKAIDSLNLLTG